MNSPAGVAFVIPVRNGAPWLPAVLAAISAQTARTSIEIITVDDGSDDESRTILDQHAHTHGIRILDGNKRGAATALNLGISAATAPLIAQVDQDVVIGEGWLDQLTSAFDDPAVAAAQGHFVGPPDAGLWSRVMALDLAQRYSALHRWTDHVCTGNTVYRRSALMDAGLFDETLGYGYDNDMSYRLVQAGHRLAFRREATSVHYWYNGLVGYARQQYGFGYGRLDVVAKHPRRVAGDDVSQWRMMVHAPAMLMVVAVGALAAGLSIAGVSPIAPAIAALVLLSALVADRLVAGVRAAIAFRNPAGLLFVPAHLVRDLAWAAAIVIWTLRRANGGAARPSNSMRPRSATS